MVSNIDSEGEFIGETVEIENGLQGVFAMDGLGWSDVKKNKFGLAYGDWRRSVRYRRLR